MSAYYGGLCPYYDEERKKCKLWDTYQDDYIIKTYCRGEYWDSYKKCANYEIKKRWGVIP